MRLINPLSTEREPQIYTPEDAVEYLLGDDRSVYVLPLAMYTEEEEMVGVDWAREFTYNADDQITNKRFLAGSWEGAFWGCYSTPQSERVEEIVEDMGLTIDDTGPIAYYDEEDKRLFPLQPNDGIYAIAKEKDGPE